jgi:TolA-binding protein
MERAFATFHDLKWEYPESQWAKYARARLVEDRFQTMKEAGTPTSVARGSLPAITEALATSPEAPRTGPGALLRSAHDLAGRAVWSARLGRRDVSREEAIAAYEKVAREHPDSAAARQARLGMAALHERLREPARALGVYEEIAAAAPETPEGARALLRIVDDCVSKKKYARALSMAETHADNPRAAMRDDALRAGAAVCRETRDAAKERAMWERLLTEHPGSRHAAEARGRLAGIFNGLDLTADELEQVPAQLLTGGSLEGLRDLLVAKRLLKQKRTARAAMLLQRVADNKNLEGDAGAVRAEAMYWLGQTCLDAGALKRAYQTLKNLTWDYPSGKWAKLARDRLEDPRFESLMPKTGTTEKKIIRALKPDSEIKKALTESLPGPTIEEMDE